MNKPVQQLSGPQQLSWDLNFVSEREPLIHSDFVFVLNSDSLT